MNLAPQVIVRRLPLHPSLLHLSPATMKLHSIALVGALANSSSAWLQRPSASVMNPLYRIKNVGSTRSLSVSPLQSTMVPEDVDMPTPLRPKGKTIAEGSIVAMFRGGLLAVRINDDIVGVDDDPEIVDTTNLLPPTSRPSNSGKTLFSFETALQILCKRRLTFKICVICFSRW